MAKGLTDFRVARLRRLSVTNVEELAELDFDLGADEGAEIYSATLVVEQVLDTPAATVDQDAAVVTLHVETESLEDAPDVEGDEVIADSEVIALWAIQSMSVSEAATGGSAWYSVATQMQWNYLQMLGQPLRVIKNLTARFITTDAALVLNGVEVVIFYRIVKLTTSELTALSLRRR